MFQYSCIYNEAVAGRRSSLGQRFLFFSLILLVSGTKKPSVCLQLYLRLKARSAVIMSSSFLISASYIPCVFPPESSASDAVMATVWLRRYRLGWQAGRQ